MGQAACNSLAVLPAHVRLGGRAAPASRAGASMLGTTGGMARGVKGAARLAAAEWQTEARAAGRCHQQQPEHPPEGSKLTCDGGRRACAASEAMPAPRNPLRPGRAASAGCRATHRPGWHGGWAARGRACPGRTAACRTLRQGGVIGGRRPRRGWARANVRAVAACGTCTVAAACRTVVLIPAGRQVACRQARLARANAGAAQLKPQPRLPTQPSCPTCCLEPLLQQVCHRCAGNGQRGRLQEAAGCRGRVKETSCSTYAGRHAAAAAGPAADTRPDELPRGPSRSGFVDSMFSPGMCASPKRHNCLGCREQNPIARQTPDIQPGRASLLLTCRGAAAKGAGVHGKAR